MQILGRRYDTGQPVAVEVVEGRIERIEPWQGAGELPWVAPGFVDLQVNGYGGQQFNDLALDVDKVAQVGSMLDSAGVTGYCPTATTHSFAMLSYVLETIAGACEASPEVACRVAGVHLEGPYLSREDGPRGAHPLEHCRPPDWDEFQRLQEAAGGRIRILTMSPEYEGSPGFIARVAASGVVVAIGHTSANSDQIRAAVDAGARLSTHLGNGAHGQLRRHPNYIWDQLAEDRLLASLIADGHHLPPSVVQTFVRAKTPQRCLLVSDITSLAGMPPGRYDNSSLGAVEVLQDGRLVIAGQRQLLAGASRQISVGIANVIRFAGLDLKTAVDMASRHPAQLINHPGGQLQPGAPASLVLFDWPGPDGQLQIRATFNHGRRVYLHS